MGIKNLILLTYLITLSGAVFPSLAAAIPYGITGHVKVYAAPHDTIERNTGGTLPVISLDDSLADQGPVLNTALASYYGDLSTGSVGAVVYAVNGQPGGDWLSAIATAHVGIADTLYLTVPAGSYPDGVEVQAHGWIEGYIEALGRGQARVQFGAHLGSGSSSSYNVLKEIHADGGFESWSISDDFLVSCRLVSPGHTLQEDTLFIKTIGVGFGQNAVLVASTTGSPGVPMEGSATVDFYNTGGFLSLDVPLGVTWTSASGVFLSQSISEPTSVLLLGSGLLVLLVFGRKHIGATHLIS